MSDAAYATLLRAISDIDPGRHVNADTVREAFDAADLNSAERGGAFRSACTGGYIKPITVLLDDGTTLGTVQVRTQHEKGKGRWAMAYRRTNLPVPDHLCGTA